MGDRNPNEISKAKVLSIGDKLALDRTIFSYDRTMMSWVRTATSLITFGFAIFKFFQVELTGRPPIQHVIGPREFAIMLITIGVVSLFVATLQHVMYIRKLKLQFVELPRSLSGIVGGLVTFLGIIALVAVILRL